MKDELVNERSLMSHDAIANWVEKAKTSENSGASDRTIKVIPGKSLKSRGGSIIDTAEKLRPWLAKMFEGVRDENGMLVQPARIRGIALNLAQYIVKERKQ